MICVFRQAPELAPRRPLQLSSGFEPNKVLRYFGIRSGKNVEDVKVFPESPAIDYPNKIRLFSRICG